MSEATRRVTTREGNVTAIGLALAAWFAAGWYAPAIGKASGIVPFALYLGCGFFVIWLFRAIYGEIARGAYKRGYQEAQVDAAEGNPRFGKPVGL